MNDPEKLRIAWVEWSGMNELDESPWPVDLDQVGLCGGATPSPMRRPLSPDT